MRRVGSYLLNLVYLGVLALASPFIVWSAVTKGKYREGYREKFWGEVPERSGNGQCIWLHAVSVGEVNLLATTLRELTSRRSDVEIVISTTTKTGYDLARRKYGERHSVFYCPLDFSWAARRAMRRVRPALLVLAELELWPNLIIAAKEQGARVAIINGRLSDNSFRGYRRAKWLVGRVLGMVDLVAAQDATTASRFRKLRGVTRGGSNDSVVVTGSLKYDGAETNRANARTKSLQTLAGISKDDIVWLVGSTQAPEEEMAVRLYAELRQRHTQLRLVIVPRHPERFDEVGRVLDGSGLPWHRRSQLEASLPVPQSIILVDTVGELGAWWGTASIGFVGGSFGDRGGQNMIEPAAYGVATCFGPNTWNFRDIVAALLNADAAEVVHDEAALEEFVARCLDEPDFARALGERARGFVATQLGATKRTADLLETLLPVAKAKSTAAA
jgi:3-deoxy-D-manno-octulosonic-acid transferase